MIDEDGIDHKFCEPAVQTTDYLMGELLPHFLSIVGQTIVLTRASLEAHGMEGPEEDWVFMSQSNGASLRIIRQPAPNELLFRVQVPMDDIIRMQEQAAEYKRNNPKGAQ